ncbi:kinase-like protein [Athelia psychrophila]|uniref:Kinase-like protein n=1 Tax=Athelia psychrophila TaxID=1759441 RepID=A0A166FJZ4_9AGAM|nr:kinase-like protein [Fibularhizoctonia sp. CBS 109695]
MNQPTSNHAHGAFLNPGTHRNPAPLRNSGNPQISGRLHIQATDELSPAQIAKLDITRHIEKFQMLHSNFIGSGCYGQVHQGWYIRPSDGVRIRVAIKALMYTRKSSQEMEKVTQRLMREIITWKRVSQHEYVADLMGIYQTPNNPPYLVMPYYENNKLLDYLARCHPDKRLVLAKEIAKGLDVLHGNHVIHGDLKPENIFVSDDGHAKIADFGVSVIPQLAGFTTTSMNPRNVRYSAPELTPLYRLSIRRCPRGIVISSAWVFSSCRCASCGSVRWDHVLMFCCSYVAV